MEDLVGVIEGQTADQHGVHEGEDRGVHADAEAQGERGDQREPGILDEQPAGVAESWSRVICCYTSVDPGSSVIAEMRSMLQWRILSGALHQT